MYQPSAVCSANGGVDEQNGPKVALSAAMWILRTNTEGVAERVFRLLPGEPKTIGRATGADFIVDAALVSRVHCRLTVLPGGELEIKDLGSTNGTFVNGERVETARVAPGDTLKVGRLEIVAMKEE
jgi:pSer/pThr/pTyr-binding forkhead associated (FHA) protein